MKQTLKFLSSVLLISMLGLVNCHKYETGGSPTNGYLVGTYINGLVRSATTGNCAISVNLGSLYAGAIVQTAAGSASAFPAAKYVAVTTESGTTLALQGYSATTLQTATAQANAVASVATLIALTAGSASATCQAAGTAAAVCNGAVGTAGGTLSALLLAANTTGASAASITAGVPATASASAIAAANAATGAGTTTASTAAATTVANTATAADAIYKLVPTNAIYVNVPYNKKYDAFLTNSADGTSWTNALRATTIASQKVSTDLTALAGSLLSPYFTIINTAVSAGTFTAATVTTAQAAAQASMNTFYATFSTAEKLAMAQALGSSNTVTTLDTLVANASTTQIYNTGTANSAVSGTGTFGSIACAAGGGNSGVVILLNTNTCVSGINAAFGTVNTGSFTTGLTTAGTAYLARLSYAKGAALMACARVPRTSCTASSLLTSTRDADVASLVNNYQTINATAECRKPSTGVLAAVLSQGATGLPKEATFLGKNTTVNLGGGRIYQNTAAAGGSEGSTTGLSSTGILAEKAYPKSGALLGIAATFTTAHPMNSGTTPYDTATFYGGSNINVANVTSCDALGLGNYGPTPIKPTDSLTTVNSKKTLTDVKEVVYAFSTNNTVAKAYETAIATTSPFTATVDAIACNRQMRKLTPISSLLNVGTTLADLNTTSGDGGATSLVTACVYGADSATRTVVSTTLGTTLPGLDSCPVAASSGASSFGATGLTTYTSFPDGQ